MGHDIHKGNELVHGMLKIWKELLVPDKAHGGTPDSSGQLTWSRARKVAGVFVGLLLFFESKRGKGHWNKHYGSSRQQQPGGKVASTRDWDTSGCGQVRPLELGYFI